MKPNLEKRLESAYGEAPDRFHASVRRALNGLGEKEAKPVKRYAYKTALIALAALVALLGTALAVGNTMGILDFFGEARGIKPTDDAQSAIRTHLGVGEGGGLRFTVREAVYDGACVRALIEVLPTDAEACVAKAGWISEDEDGVSDEALAGRTVIPFGTLMIDSGDDSVPVDILDTSVSVRRSGDALLLYAEAPLLMREVGVVPETLKLVLNVVVGDFVAELYVPFSLDLCKLTSARYTPETYEVGDMRILDVILTMTPFAEYLEVRYTVSVPETHLAFQEGVTYYGTPGGVWLHADPECSGMRKATAYSQEEAENAGKGLCPVCTGVMPETLPTTHAGLCWSVCKDGALGELFVGMDEGKTDDPLTNAYVQTWIYPCEEAFPDELTLRATVGESHTDILCRTNVGE